MDVDARALGSTSTRIGGVFLAYMVIAAVLALFFLLYFNRVFASLASWAIRTWTWHHYGIYIDIQAIQFSLLGGRIFFVGLKYHGNNETILVQNGHITWSYWLRRVRHINLGKRRTGKAVADDDLDGNKVHQESKTKSRLPCRLNVNVSGVEWFVYNRSAAYDCIVAGLAEMDGNVNGDSVTSSVPNEDHTQQGDDAHHKLRKRRVNSSNDTDERDNHSYEENETRGFFKEKLAQFEAAARGKHIPAPSEPDDSSDADNEARLRNTQSGASKRHSGAEFSENTALPALLQLFPIYFICDRAALVMGNENTSAILVFKTQTLSGEIDAKHTTTPDPYRQIFRFNFQKPIMELRENDDYREDQTTRAVRERQIAEDTEPTSPRSFFRHHRRIVYSQLRNLVPYFRSSVESFTSSDPRSPPVTAASARIPGSAHWQGLSRYLDGPGGDEKTRWVSSEYAMLNPILESPEAHLTLYWDSVGRVTTSAMAGLANNEKQAKREGMNPESCFNVNGNEPSPAWGMAFSIRGGDINYGPWADRKRAELQRVFFPGLSKDAKPAQRLPVGAYRTPTEFKVYVELDDEVTLRVPLRESSKNWRYKGKEMGTKFQSARDKKRNRSRFKRSEPASSTTSQRPYGWLDIKIASNATVSYTMDMLASSSGFCAKLDLDLPRVEISSSVNQEVLWRSGALRTSCDLSTPLQWNSLRKWRFHVTSNDLELFLLRDHVFLLTDLIDDWGTGPPSEYLVFTPFEYFIDLSFPNIKMYLNVNDANIINDPTSFDDNTFIILASTLLEASVCIPLDKFRPPSNAIPFSVRTEAATIQLHVPPWSTQHMFVRDKTLGYLKSLVLEGKYDYHAVTASGNSDTLVLNVTGKRPVFNAYGFVVRYFLKLKDNYFGDDVHFKTLEEHQDGIRLKLNDPDAELATRPPHKASNDLDVIVNVLAEDPRILLPAYIYSKSRLIQIDMANLAADLRFTNYYMDLDVVLPPLSLSLEVEKEGNHDNGGLEDHPVGSISNTQLFIDGIHVYGSRLFGLPPTEPTYLCNWDCSIGAITGECTADFLTALANGGKAFGFTFDDDENALVPYHTIVMYDVTFLRANVKSVSIWLHVEEAAFLLSLGEGVDVCYNDWARQHYSKRGDISIPNFEVSCVNSESAMRHKSRPAALVETDAFLKTGLSIAIIGRKNDFSNERALQQALIRREDQRTQRAAFLLLPKLMDRTFIPDHVDPPAQPVPPIPLPVSVDDVARDGLSLSSSAMSISSKRRLRRQKSQRSFLSASASSQSSVVRPQSSVHTGSASRQSRQSSALPFGRQSVQPVIPMDSHRGGRSVRAPSVAHEAASSRQSGLFNIVDNAATDSHRQGPSHNTMAFSSKYFAPYLPLENVKPDISEAMAHGSNGVNCFGSHVADGAKLDGKDGEGADNMFFADFGLEDIDPESLSEDRVHSSIMIRVRERVSAFFNPASAKHIAALISALQPRNPDDILDTVQMASVSGIIGGMGRRNMKGCVGDFVVQLPRANMRFLNATSPNTSSEEQDQYDVSISNMTFMSRENVSWENAMKPEENLQHHSFQLRLGSIELTASERAAHVCKPQAAFMATVENVLVSMGTKDLAYLDAHIESIDGQLSSEKIEYIASLVHRTGVLASELGEAFAAPLSYSDKVRPHLVQRLIAAGTGVTDPVFIVRPSAVLRSANEHLRIYDSWKVAMRLRQIWFLMRKDQKEQIIRECLGQEPLLPFRDSPLPDVVVAPIGGTVREVISKMELWHAWDLGDLTRTLFLQEMFPSLKADMYRAAAARRPIPAFMTVVRVERLQFALDPGPKQNEITLLDLTVRFENSAAAAVISTPPQSAPGAPAITINPMKPTTILNVYCSESAVRLNWEICELVEDVIRLFKKRVYEKSRDASKPPSSSGSKAVAATPATKDGKTAEPKNAKPIALVDQSTLHVVFAMDHGSLILDTINLHVHMKSQGTKSSLLLRHISGQIIDTNFITSCDFISSKVKSHSEVICWSELQTPSVFIAHDMQTTRRKYEHTIKATASSRNFLFSVKQDPLAIVETLDLLVKDEVAQLYQLSDLFPLAPDDISASGPRKPSATSMHAKVKQGNVKIAERLSAFNFKIALFLEEYTISLPLLRSLAYKISGVVARVAVAATYGKEVIFDFDVKENSHDMQVTVNNTPRSISLLQIPPTNGRVTARMGEHEQTVSVFSSLELVQLDAAAVYSLLSALNRPEISNTISDMQQQLKAVQRHVKEIFGSTSQLPAPAGTAGPTQEVKSKSATPVIYSIHSTFAGLEIFSDVSLKSDPEPLAHLLFKLGSVQLEMTNRLDNRGPVLAYPELHINIRQTAFEILKGSEDQMTSCGSMAFAALITASSKIGEDGKERRLFDVKSDGFDVSLSPDTVSTVVDVLGYMGDKIKDLDTSREMEYLRKLRQSKPRIAINDEEQPDDDEEEPDIIDSFLSSIAYTFEIRSIQVNWLCALTAIPSAAGAAVPSPIEAQEDLVLTLKRIEFGTRTKNSARLTIEDLQLQMVPPTQDKKNRSANSALLPEVVFNVAYFSTARSRRFAFQAVGKSLDLRLTSEFIVPAAHLKDSIELSIKNVQQVSRRWNPVTSASNTKPAFTTSGSGARSPSKPPGSPEKQPMFGSKRLESFLVDVDFAGAVVYISGTKNGSPTSANIPFSTTNPAPSGGLGAGSSRPRRSGIGGKYGQFTSDESGGMTILRSPGLAWKMEYRDTGRGDPSLYAEVKIDPSSNVLYPSVVPLVMDLTASIQEVVSKSGKDKDPELIEDSPERAKQNTETEEDKKASTTVAKLKPEESILLSAANPNAMLGRLKLNLGIRIHKQQFTLSCQPIARVAATTSFDDVYLTMNTIQTVEHGNFVAISGNITRLQASVQHVYSRESTGSFEVESIVLSLMNSKHVSGVSGVSALLKVSPMKVAINVRQVQDFMLFQEIWTPRDIRKATTAPISPVLTKVPAETTGNSTQQTQQTVHLAQRYQQVAATAAFPWTASISMAALEINVDLGQALGKSIFAIEEFWVSSKKTSDWEQNLCLGFRRIGINSTGRMSGFIALEDFKLRTSIEWPQREQALSKTPLIQASISFSQLRVKASFDYQAFLVADVRSMNFLMYNVRRGKQERSDRLVAVFEGDAVQVFGTTTSAAQGVALYQAFLRLVQERKANFETSLREIEKFTNRRPSTTAAQAPSSSNAATLAMGSSVAELAPAFSDGDNGNNGIISKSPISLDTDVVVTLRAVNLGVFPNTFTDNQVFKMEALNAQARFAANIYEGRIHSDLGLTLGQLRIGLAGVRHIPTKTSTKTSKTAAPGGSGAPKSIGELSVDDVVLSATGSRGGTILKVPRVEAGMQTWQTPDSKQIDYIFKSAFEGKVEVGWNYSRISAIRGMWANHNRTFEQTWGRGIPLAAIRVTGVPGTDNTTSTTDNVDKAGADKGTNAAADKKPDGKQTKITAEVHVPQSKFQYNPLQPAVIETPQLRDMGEATPPLEWIGLHRDRLPNLTHQIVIVSLLELAGEVEDAYSRILGSS